MREFGVAYDITTSGFLTYTCGSKVSIVQQRMIFKTCYHISKGDV